MVKREHAIELGRDFQISKVSCTVLDVPIRRPHKLAPLTMQHQSYLLVVIRTHGGLTGYGEGVTPGGPWWSGESIESMKSIIDNYLAPSVIGIHAGDVRSAVGAMNRVAANAPFAKAAMDIALWDLAGKAASVPISTLLGGQLREHVPIRWALATGDIGVDVAEAEGMMNDNVARSFKIKAGSRAAADDVAYVEAIRRQLGSDVDLQIDLNSTWDRVTALRYGPRLMASVSYLEQPLGSRDLRGLADLRSLGVRIMVDESLCSPQDALMVIDANAADYFSLKLMKSAGISGIRSIGEIAEAAGYPCYGGTFMESSIGISAHLSVITTLPQVTEGCELFGGLWLMEDIAETPVSYSDGSVIAVAGPGHGIIPDSDKVKKFTRH